MRYATNAHMPESWVKAATKVLKGKDPLEVLAWHTAEVRSINIYFYSKTYHGINFCLRFTYFSNINSIYPQ